MNDAPAFGMIETRGLVAALVAADAMLKAADVRLVARTRVDPALVTVQIEGEVAAVRAAVDAGRQAAERVGKVLATHVIPRPADGVREMMSAQPKKKAAVRPAPAPETPRVPEAAGSLPAARAPARAEASGNARALSDRSVQELRALARSLPEGRVQGRAIARATKQELLGLLAAR